MIVQLPFSPTKVLLKGKATAQPRPASKEHDSVIAVHFSEANIMFLVIGIVLFLLWIGGFFLFHITSFFIHILLILAVIVIVFHFLRGAA
jgi:hypothetical protein